MGKSSGRVLVIGASGAVGQEILKRLEKEESVREIAVVAKRPLDERMKTPKLREYSMAFGALDAESECFDADAVFCALGTTMKKAGSKDQFRKVDHDFPLETARIAKRRGVPHFLIVSAYGANAQSRFFYNQVKGSVEQDLMALHLPNLTIMRPSVLIRPSDEWRPAELISQKLARVLPKKWRSVSVTSVAAAMVDSFKNPQGRVRIIENAEILLTPLANA